MFQRLFNMLLGTWLVVSAFMWPHVTWQKANAIACGALVIGLSALSFYSTTARRLSTLVAIWLFVSAVFTLGLREVTLWHNAVVAIVIFTVSLSGDGVRLRHRAAA